MRRQQVATALALIALVFSASGCAQSIVMRNPQDGRVVVCQDNVGAFGGRGLISQAGQCARQLEREGWTRAGESK